MCVCVCRARMLLGSHFSCGTFFITNPSVPEIASEVNRAEVYTDSFLTLFSFKSSRRFQVRVESSLCALSWSSSHQSCAHFLRRGGLCVRERACNSAACQRDVWWIEFLKIIAPIFIFFGLFLKTLQVAPASLVNQSDVSKRCFVLIFFLIYFFLWV